MAAGTEEEGGKAWNEERGRMTLQHFCSVLVGNMMILANTAAAPASVYKDRCSEL